MATTETATGPKTPEGKATSSRNSLQHGLTARETVLPWEDAAGFEAFREDLLAGLSPVGALEETLADRIVALSWRLRRFGLAEAGFFALHRSGLLAEQARAEAGRYTKIDSGSDRMFPELVGFMEDRVTVLDKAKHAAALAKAEEASALGDGETGRLALAFANREGTFANLSRYETGVERALYRALHELQRLQAVRAGVPVPPPAVVDVGLDAHGSGRIAVEIAAGET